MNGLLQLMRALGPFRLMVMAGIGVVSIAFFVFITGRLSEPNLSLLYSDLSLEDSNQIVAKLESQTMPYELRGNGTQIFVPRDQVLRLRMSMAEEGLPTGGAVGYEIFDESKSFSSSSFINNVNRLRALEGELARSIRGMVQIRAARVHLVIPERQLFARDRQDPSASIVIKTHAGVQLTKAQVLAIQHLTAAAVPGLKPNQVSVIDDRGNLLARGAGAEDGEAGAGLDAEEARRNFEAHLRKSIEELIERSVGVGKVRTQVSAEMDFDRITTNEEKFDPDGQVVRSTQLVEETAESNNSEETQPVSIETDLPQDPDAVDANGRLKNVNRSVRNEETVNYEISKTIRSHVRERGIVRRLSVAVLVDGVYEVADDGARTYKPRDEEEMQQLTTLVQSAIGFNAERGDVVEVINMQFAGAETPLSEADEGSMFDFDKNDFMRIGEIVVLGILGILVLLLVIRPLLTRLFEPPPPPAPKPAVGGPPDAAQIQAPAEVDEDSMIDLQQVEGRVKASTIKKIGDLVDKHPDETVSIIRNWMYEAK